MRRDASGHATYFNYADNFTDGNRNTFAYPTTFTDGDNYSSTSQYRFDIGALTLTHTPTRTNGGTIDYLDMTREYDDYGRVEWIRNGTNQAYTHYVYDPNDNYVHTYETIIGTTQADEFHSWQVFDGAGRVRANAADHPGGTGLYSGSYVVYDNMGRVVQHSNPNEMNGSWSPSSWALVGEDPLWRVTQQTYDWKGRPLQTTNTDGTTKVVSYGGCGCAGGEVTTVQDEHGRQKRYIKDAFGRPKMVDELNWNGSTYSTTNYTYDVLDHLTRIDQAGQTPRTFDYDGYGRLWRRTTPEQGQTTYSYYADDTVNVITDARGATTTYGYDGRHHVTSLGYGSYGGATSTANVSFLYDAGGNRFWMADGQGYGTYSYDNLGRMTSEGRHFDALGSTYYFNYGYNNVSGELISITNTWSPAQVGYGYDKAGRLTNVSGSGYAGVSNYANNISYRAFGGIKGMNYGDSKSLSTAYDGRLRPTMMNVSGVLGYKYYYDDFNEHTGRVTFAQDISQFDSSLNRTQTTSSLDRSYEYDNLGRLVFTHSGAEARAHAWTGQWGIQDGPYSQDYSYDVWGNMTQRHGWGGEVQQGSPTQSLIWNYTYTNNRRTDNSFTYDAAGNLTFDGGQTFSYDVTGQQTYASYMSVSQDYDGDGLRVKKTENSATTYYLRSSVLGGQVVAELTWSTANNAWQFNRGYVYMGSQLLAVQKDGAVYWMHEDPITKSKRVTNSSGSVVSTIELDPWGADTSASISSAFQPKKFTSYHRDDNGTDEAMFRRYNRWHSRFDQPDPYEGSYDMADPQSFNRYAYVQNDPANFVDPSGLEMSVCGIDQNWEQCVGSGYFGGFAGRGADPNRRPSPTGSSGRDIIRNAEPIFTFRGRGRDLEPLWEWTVSSMFDDWDNAYIIDVYTKHGRDLTKCVNSVFGKDANRLQYQQMKNAPTVDRSKTMAELGKEGQRHEGLAFGNTRSDAAETKTVQLASDIASSPAVRSGAFTARGIAARKYVHELGNYLSIKLSGNAYEFGDGRGILGLAGAPRWALDYDTGARLESCVFKEGSPGS
jgi:RHS repeat-associated protein